VIYANPRKTHKPDCYVGKIEIASSAPASADKALQVRQVSGTLQASANSGGDLTRLGKVRQHCKPGAALSGWWVLVGSDKPMGSKQ
jgi:hypothetical protein